jgi:hypothetical protein
MLTDYVGAQGEAILGQAYVQLLERHRPTLIWEDEYHEHVFMYTEGRGEHRVYYPTLQSVQHRLALAEELGTGIRCVVVVWTCATWLMPRAAYGSSARGSTTSTTCCDGCSNVSRA